MDELAHSNAAGSRHPKRWQDVDELPTRLKAGKVYQAQQAERASRNFFRKGNLIALRELALRRTADRIEDDVQAYRIEKSINSVWKTGSALLACIGSRSGGEHVIRSTARLAGQLNAEWHAIYIETPQLQRLPPAQRERILTRIGNARRRPRSSDLPRHHRSTRRRYPRCASARRRRLHHLYPSSRHAARDAGPGRRYCAMTETNPIALLIEDEPQIRRFVRCAPPMPDAW